MDSEIDRTDEQVLLRRVKAGEPGAFKEMVELFQDRVLNTCYRFLLNREDAEDIAQEVFIEVHRSIASFMGQSSLSTWLYRVAVNKSIDYLRKKKRKKRFALIKNLFNMEEEGKELPAPENSDPEQYFRQEERMQILRDAIDTLPENQRVAFTLSKCEGLSNKKIAEVMGTSLSSVESLMHRAKANLRKKLFDYFERDLKRKGTILAIIFLIILLHFAKGCAQVRFCEKKILKGAQDFSCFYVSSNRGDLTEVTCAPGVAFYYQWFCLRKYLI